MRQIAAFAAAAFLSGCGVITNVVQSNVLDYSDAIADTNNKFLLTNILEARDDAPLHFMEIPKINGSLQATASLSGSIPFNSIKYGKPVSGSVLTDALTPNVSVQSTPSFEVDNLDTKEFAQGMTSAIDPKQVKYWIGKGLDRRVLLLLFFSSVKITNLDCSALGGGALSGNAKADYVSCKTGHGASIVVQNDPRHAADEFSQCMNRTGDFGQCHAKTGFEHYLRMINDMKEGFTANTYGERSLLAKNVDIDPKDLASFDPAKYELEYVTGRDTDAVLGDIKGNLRATVTGTVRGKLAGKLTGSVTSKKSSHYNVYSATEDGKIALCFRGQPIADPGVPDPNECTSPKVTDITTPGDEAEVPTDTAHFNDPGAICSDIKGQAIPGPGQILMQTSQSTLTAYCRIFLGYLAYLKAVKASYDEAPAGAFEATLSAGGMNYRIVVSIRSAGEMVRYVGDVLYYQDVVAREHERFEDRADVHHNVPLTLDYSISCHNPQTDADRALYADDPGCALADGGYLFRLNGEGPARFGVDYSGEHYSVGIADPGDHTLDVLGVLSLSVTLNRSASDIHPSPVVQLIP